MIHGIFRRNCQLRSSVIRGYNIYVGHSWAIYYFKLFCIKYNFNLCIWHIMLYLNCQCEKLGEKQQHVKQSTVDGPDQKKTFSLRADCHNNQLQVHGLMPRAWNFIWVSGPGPSAASENQKWQWKIPNKNGGVNGKHTCKYIQFSSIFHCHVWLPEGIHGWKPSMFLQILSDIEHHWTVKLKICFNDSLRLWLGSPRCTLWLFNIAMEDPHF